MDYLQYSIWTSTMSQNITERFKPYYKWITFNTEICNYFSSIPGSFKPYYKWITFNT